jgi:prepilin-type N-terminal cleavage/methylation domain-containing protein
MSYGRKGFTMVELLVVVVIVGILAAVAIPKYTRSVENGKADAAVSQLKMIGTANRMYSIDHSGYYVTGGALVSGSAACSATCPPTCPVTDLVGCKYLPINDYGTMAYQIAACGSGINAGTCPLGLAGGNLIACAKRRAPANAPYNGWGYTMDVNGVVLCHNSSGTGCGGADQPPAPAQ